MIGKSTKEIEDFITSFREDKQQYKFTHEAAFERYLRVDGKHGIGGSVEFTQPHLINKIIEAMGIEPKMT